MIEAKRKAGSFHEKTTTLKGKNYSKLLKKGISVAWDG